MSLWRECLLPQKNPIRVPSYLGLNKWHHWLVWAAVFLWCAILGEGGCLGAARVFWLLVPLGLRWVYFNVRGPSCGLVAQRWGSLLPRGWGWVFGGQWVVGLGPGWGASQLRVRSSVWAPGAELSIFDVLLLHLLSYYLVLFCCCHCFLSLYLPPPSLFLPFTSCPPCPVPCNLVCSQTKYIPNRYRLCICVTWIGIHKLHKMYILHK